MRRRYGPVLAAAMAVVLVVVAAATGSLPNLGAPNTVSRSGGAGESAPCMLVTKGELVTVAGLAWNQAVGAPDESGSCAWSVMSASGGQTLKVEVLSRSRSLEEIRADFANSSGLNGAQVTAVVSASSSGLRPTKTSIRRAFYYGYSSSGFSGVIAEREDGSLIQIDVMPSPLAQASLDTLAVDAFSHLPAQK